MEIQGIRRAQIRTYAPPAQAAAESQPAPKTDRLSLSQQAADFLRAQNEAFQEKLAQEAQRMREAQAEAESGKQELDAAEEGLKVMQRCQEIARRIMRGDKVPPEDERYLMENDPEGYKLTIACRKVKKDPKEWESVLKDDEPAEKSGDAEGTEETGAAAESGDTRGGTSGGDSAGGGGTASGGTE